MPGRPRSNAIAGAILAQRLNAVARTEVLGRELDEMRGLAEVRMREVADRDAHIFELERRLQDLHQEKENLKDEAQRRWLLGIPHAFGRARRKLTDRKESNPG